MRTIQTHIIRACISSFVQYSLLISLAVGPLGNPAVRAQQKRSGSAPAMSKNADADPSAALADERLRSPGGKRGEGRSEQHNFDQGFGEERWTYWSAEPGRTCYGVCEAGAFGPRVHAF